MAAQESEPDLAPSVATAGVSPLRAMLLILGAAGTGMLSVWSWMLERVNGSFVLRDGEQIVARLPIGEVIAVLLATALGGIGVIWALLRDQRLRTTIAWIIQWIKQHPLAAGVMAIVLMLGVVDGYELFVDAETRRWNRDKGVGLRAYMVREDLKGWLLFASTVMTALAISALWPAQDRFAACAARVRNSIESRRKTWLAAALALPVALGGFMAWFALDAVPHFSDSLTYLTQGRMLWAGELSMPKPAHPDLFIGSLFFVTDQQHLDPATGEMIFDGTRFFGKYPAGWPFVLGFFDKLHIGYLANATMTGLAVLLTYALGRQITTHRVAVLAAVLFGLSPWAWFNGAHFASHVASTIAVTGFWWLYLKTMHGLNSPPSQGGAGGGSGVQQESAHSERVDPTLPQPLPEREGSRGAEPRHLLTSGLGAGLFLGFAVLVRPFDAVMFAMPAVAASAWFFLRSPKRWFVPSAMITIGALVGVGIYAWTNAMTTGSATISPYKLEGRWQADWDTAIWSPVLRMWFQWAELNARVPGYGIGGMTAAVLGLMIAISRGRLRQSPALSLLLAANAIFFGSATLFLFTNVWWGPRWLLPVTPLVALLAAELVDVMLAHAAPGRSPGLTGENPGAVQSADADEQIAIPSALGPRPLAPGPSPLALSSQLGLSILAAGLIVGLAVEYAGRLWQHRLAPPHSVSGDVGELAAAMKLTNAVVGLPLGQEMEAAAKALGDAWRTQRKAPTDPRTGMVHMRAPMADNAVIYVRKVDRWAAKAAECFPQRQLYELIADRNAADGFVVVPVSPRLEPAR